MTSLLSPDRESLATALDAFRMGRVVLISDQGQPHRGAIVVAAAERVSDDVVNFMATHARGLVGWVLLRSFCFVLCLEFLASMHVPYAMLYPASI